MIDSNTLEAILYAHGGEMKKKELLALLEMSTDTLRVLIDELADRLQGHSLEIVETDSTLSLRTNREYRADIEKFITPDADKDIKAAALEVLSIVLYKGVASRADIDYMRGVNSSGTLRQLVLRGLLERTKETDGARAWVYTVTPELLAYLDIHTPEELPDYLELHGALTHHPQSTTYEDN